MEKVLLSLNNITVRGGGEILFDSFNFRVREGEQWAVVGASGIEKSAFLDALAGKLTVSRGEMAMPFLLDEAAENLEQSTPVYQPWLMAQVSTRQHFRNLSRSGDYYYQQRFNSFDMENSETVEQYLLEMAMGEVEGYWTMNRVCERLNLTELLQKRLVMLSSGETKRLLIAAALLQNPFFLLLDHPLMGLDVKTRTEFDQFLLEITRSGIHLIMATSHQEIPSVITHVAVLENKTISRCFTVAEFQNQQLRFSGDVLIDTGELQSLLGAAEEKKYETIISMKDVVVRYGEKLILNRVNWKVLSGERWALLGHNGAGKSTLLSLINGDNPQAFANDIILFDRKKGSGESIWDIKRNIGFVSPELIACFPADNSCLDVIESGFYDTLGLFRISDPAKVAVAQRWLKLFGVENVARKPFRNVSASEQRLCLLARALVKNPALLILDEPFQGLDEGLKEHLKTLLEEICARTNVTLIYVSHYQSEIPKCVEYVLVLENGEVAEQR